MKRKGQGKQDLFCKAQTGLKTVLLQQTTLSQNCSSNIRSKLDIRRGGKEQQPKRFMHKHKLFSFPLSIYFITAVFQNAHSPSLN